MKQLAGAMSLAFFTLRTHVNNPFRMFVAVLVHDPAFDAGRILNSCFNAFRALAPGWFIRLPRLAASARLVAATLQCKLRAFKHPYAVHRRRSCSSG